MVLVKAQAPGLDRHSGMGVWGKGGPARRMPPPSTSAIEARCLYEPLQLLQRIRGHP